MRIMFTSNGSKEDTEFLSKLKFKIDPDRGGFSQLPVIPLHIDGHRLLAVPLSSRLLCRYGQDFPIYEIGLESIRVLD